MLARAATSVLRRRCSIPTRSTAHARSLSTTQAASSLKILIVDGYSQKSRDEFEANDLQLASALYQDMLRQQAPRGVAIEFETIFPCQDDYVPPTDAVLSTFHGAAFTGSSLSAYGVEDDVKRQVDLMRRTFECGVSSFGSCWGIQIAAVALGGAVELNPHGREVGFGRKVRVTPEGRSHPLFKGKKSVFETFMSHSDEVTRIPSGAIVLAGNDHSVIQAMAVTRHGTESWFVQYHPEYDLDYYASLIATRKERMTSMGFFRSPDEIDTYVDELKMLHADPTGDGTRWLRWKYGIDDDVLSNDIKRAEARNWLRHILVG